MKASAKTAQFEKRIHIKKGYYAGLLKSVKPRQKQDGTAIEGKYGKQIICMFEIYGENGQPLTTTTENSEGGSMTKAVELPMVLNSEYKQKDGTYRTAVTPNSLITKVFQNLGWKFSEEGFDTDEFIGKTCELNIDDYEAKETKQDGNGNDVETTYKASSIKDVNKLEEPETNKEAEKVVDNKGEAEQPSITTEEEVETMIQKRMSNLQKLNAEGKMTPQGYRQAMEELERIQVAGK